ncbi:MAG: hypothetical protein ACEQSB_03480 [Undibacterium sp.]
MLKMKIILLAVLILGGYTTYQYLMPPFDDSRELFAGNQPLTATLLATRNEKHKRKEQRLEDRQNYFKKQENK